MFWMGALAGVLAVVLGRLIFNLSETSEVATLLFLAASKSRSAAPSMLSDEPDRASSGNANRAVGA